MTEMLRVAFLIIGALIVPAIACWFVTASVMRRENDPAYARIIAHRRQGRRWRAMVSAFFVAPDGGIAAFTAKFARFLTIFAIFLSGAVLYLAIASPWVFDR